MFHFLEWSSHVLFEPFVWINTLSNVYFIIVLTSNAIHKMFLDVQEVSPFFVGTLRFWATLLTTGFFLLFFDPRGRPWFFFRLVWLSSSWLSIPYLFSSSTALGENNVFFKHCKGCLFATLFLQCQNHQVQLFLEHVGHRQLLDFWALDMPMKLVDWSLISLQEIPPFEEK